MFSAPWKRFSKHWAQMDSQVTVSCWRHTGILRTFAWPSIHKAQVWVEEAQLHYSVQQLVLSQLRIEINDLLICTDEDSCIDKVFNDQVINQITVSSRELCEWVIDSKSSNFGQLPPVWAQLQAISFARAYVRPLTIMRHSAAPFPLFKERYRLNSRTTLYRAC